MKFLQFFPPHCARFLEDLILLALVPITVLDVFAAQNVKNKQYDVQSMTAI